MELNYLKIQEPNGYMYGGDQTLFGRKAARTGCGMIAACDYILYSMGKREMSHEEYSGFVCSFRDEEAYRHRHNPVGLPALRIARLINRHISGSEVGYIRRMSLTEEDLRALITRAVSAGLPVIVRIGLNGKRLPYSIVFPARDKRIRKGRTDWHYITVTGINEKGRVIFSSWGGKGETDIALLYRELGITGGAIADKSLLTSIKGK